MRNITKKLVSHFNSRNSILYFATPRTLHGKNTICLLVTIQNATQRVDTLIAENPGKSLDDLVSSKTINNDQKAQALKKPSLQAELASLEEQVTKAKQMDAVHQEALAKERELFQAKHTKELDDMKEATEARVRVETEKELRTKFLTFGRFLKAAAARRQETEEELDLEGKAFEGVLSNVYTGDVTAVEAIEKLINGSDEKVRDYTGELDVTCKCFSADGRAPDH
jgi:hypothetical protein